MNTEEIIKLRDLIASEHGFMWCTIIPELTRFYRAAYAKALEDGAVACDMNFYGSSCAVELRTMAEEARKV